MVLLKFRNAISFSMPMLLLSTSLSWPWESVKPHLFTVVIDPGHGGQDPGAIGPCGVKEKDITLAIALRLNSLLKGSSGIIPVLTRGKDVFVKLADRTKIANRKEADLFVSIHCNSIGGSKALKDTTCGYKVFINSPAEIEDDRLVAMKENSAIQFEQAGKTGDTAKSLELILLSMLHNEFMKESQNFAGCIVDKMSRTISETSKQHTGLGQAGFYVLTGAHMPSVLVEIGYVSHPHECNRLQSRDFQDKVAKAIWQGVLAFKKQYEITK
jgi:N-acetylmuramoyl-L-alanine amidase